MFLLLPSVYSPQKFFQSIELGEDCPIACEIEVILPVHDIFKKVIATVDNIYAAFIVGTSGTLEVFNGHSHRVEFVESECIAFTLDIYRFPSKIGRAHV